MAGKVSSEPHSTLSHEVLAVRIVVSADDLPGDAPLSYLVDLLDATALELLRSGGQRLAVMRTGDAVVLWSHTRCPAQRRAGSCLLSLGRNIRDEALARLVALLAVRHFARRGRVVGIYRWQGSWWAWAGNSQTGPGFSKEPQVALIGELFA